jgi:hypothetical protein
LNGNHRVVIVVFFVLTSFSPGGQLKNVGMAGKKIMSAPSAGII